MNAACKPSEGIVLKPLVGDIELGFYNTYLALFLVR